MQAVIRSTHHLTLLLLQEYNRARANPPPSSKLKLGRDPKPISKGADPIYLGFGKT